MKVLTPPYRCPLGHRECATLLPCRLRRYTHKEAYTGPHRSSKPFFAFKEAQAKYKIQITGQSYYETPDGFMF